MTQAVLEGVAFAIRDSFEVAKSLGIQIERTKICGGGAKSPLWRRMIANVLNIKVDRIESEEGPALAEPCWQPLPAVSFICRRGGRKNCSCDRDHRAGTGTG